MNERFRSTKSEWAAFEAEEKRAAEKKAYDAAAPERAAKALRDAEWQRKRIREICTDYQPELKELLPVYDGRFTGENISGQITAAITEAYNEFAENYSIDDTTRKRLVLILQNSHPNADTSRLSTWESLWAWYKSKITLPVEAVVSAPVVPEALADPLAGLIGRDRENKERQLYRESVLKEKILGEEYAEVLADLINPTGKVLSGENSAKFLFWLSEPAQKRRFKTKTDIKYAFAEFFGTTEVLTESEIEELKRRQAIEAMDSQSVKAAVGFNNSYGPAGYRAGRQ